MDSRVGKIKGRGGVGLCNLLVKGGLAMPIDRPFACNYPEYYDDGTGAERDICQIFCKIYLFPEYC